MYTVKFSQITLCNYIAFIVIYIRYKDFLNTKELKHLDLSEMYLISKQISKKSMFRMDFANRRN